MNTKIYKILFSTFLIAITFAFLLGLSLVWLSHYDFKKLPYDTQYTHILMQKSANPPPQLDDFFIQTFTENLLEHLNVENLEQTQKIKINDMITKAIMNDLNVIKLNNPDIIQQTKYWVKGELSPKEENILLEIFITHSSITLDELEKDIKSIYAPTEKP